jgi:hypothetical protein
MPNFSVRFFLECMRLCMYFVITELSKACANAKINFRVSSHPRLQGSRRTAALARR